ncbi:hypothetical protein [Saccharopolyspora shandongensis]|uniref:hypothetical protein n=1 Tax=Saccharopolyspora shandongensis TaxID=418495 RepID=UPI00115F8E31|nr:hypothetical protein [Saccharopolyspora shandongensis]
MPDIYTLLSPEIEGLLGSPAHGWQGPADSDGLTSICSWCHRDLTPDGPRLMERVLHVSASLYRDSATTSGDDMAQMSRDQAITDLRLRFQDAPCVGEGAVLATAPGKAIVLLTVDNVLVRLKLLGLDRDTNGEVVEVAATQAADVVNVTAREITRRLEQLLR